MDEISDTVEGMKGGEVTEWDPDVSAGNISSYNIV
jgi:hypothetical protein